MSLYVHPAASDAWKFGPFKPSHPPKRARFDPKAEPPSCAKDALLFTRKHSSNVPARGSAACSSRAVPLKKGLKARPEDRTALLRAFAEGGADRLAAGAGGRGADLNLVGAAVAVAVVIRAAAHRAGNPLLVLGFVGLVAVHTLFSVPFRKKVPQSARRRKSSAVFPKNVCTAAKRGTDAAQTLGSVALRNTAFAFPPGPFGLQRAESSSFLYAFRCFLPVHSLSRACRFIPV